MRLVLVSNIWNHHMAPLAAALHAKLGSAGFTWILTEQVPLEQRQLGYDGMKANVDWVAGPPETSAREKELHDLCLNADVAVMGSGPVDERVAAGKLTFIMGERLLKHRSHLIRIILRRRYAESYRQFRSMTGHPNAHALAIGFFAGADLERVGGFGARVWSWGYFPEVNPEPPGPRDASPVNILWAGRMLAWKRVDVLLRALSRVQHAPWFGGCTLVGEGEEQVRLVALARRLNLESGKVRFTPPMHYAQVRSLMRESDIYVLPSSRREGWGAVVNEAMSEGCVVVANREAGSAQVLVQEGVTGLLFDDGDAAMLAKQLAKLGSDHALRMTLRSDAWEMLTTNWHPAIAADRLLALVDGVEGKGALPQYSTGPCCPVYPNAKASVITMALPQ
jgi:glycosyltransferase involved in cell wall biosynthesis